MNRRSTREAPWRAGLRAARANLLPGLAVQTVMLSLLLGYYFVPATHDWLTQLAELKGRWGAFYSGIASIIAGAFLPELLRVTVFQRGRATLGNLGNLAFTIPFYCGMGIVVDFFYRGQAIVFGSDVSVPVVTTKVLVDQLLFNPLFSAPVTVWCYEWKNRGRPPRMSNFFTWRYYREEIVPVLVAVWGVWLPIVTILYSLPSLLQIPMFALALTLWVMLYTWMSEEQLAPNPVPPVG